MVYIKREIEDEIKKWLESREIIAIRGPRQSGKTTLLNKLSETLQKTHNKENIHFITMEDDMQRERFEKNPKEFVEFYITNNSKHFFLFDEIQYVKNAGKILKLLFDIFKNIKIIVTGSSTMDINQLGSYLVGRILFFELFPFSFPEFLSAKDKKLYKYYQKNAVSLKKPKSTGTVFLNELNKHLREYIVFGGYPRIVLEKSKEKKKVLLKNLFITYLEKDIASIYGPKYKNKIINSFRYLASVMGNVIKYDDICMSTGLYYRELKDILSILENSYILRIIRPFHKNLVTEIKKNPKIYFIDTGLRNAILGRFEFTDIEFGHLLENYVLNVIRDCNYWRTTAKAEVDFIMDGIPIEVKTKQKITTSFRSFVKHYKPKYGFFITMDDSGKMKINSTAIYILNACLIKKV